MGWGKFLEQAGKAGATLAITTSGALAQGQGLDAPYKLQLDLTTSLSAHTNKALTFSSPKATFEATQSVGFGLSTETSTQQLSFTSSGSALLSSGSSGQAVQFTQPGAKLQYARQSANSTLSVSANYQEGDVSDSYLLADPLDPTIFDSIADSGTLKSLSGNVGFRSGIGAPFGLGLTAGYSDVSYFDITTPNIYDRTTWSLGATAYLRYSPVTDGTVAVNYEDYTAQNLTNRHRETTTYTVGLSHTLARGLSIAGSVGYRTQSTTDLGTTSTDANSFANFSATQDMPNGSLSGGLQFGNQENGEDYVISLDRSLELRNGSISAGLSGTKFPTGGLQYVGNITYAHELADGSFNMTLNQSLQQNDSNDVVRVTRAGVGYEQQVTETSSLGLDLSLNQSLDIGGGQPTTTLANLSASYNYALNSDWNLALGYSHRRSIKESAGTANSDSISLSLSRALAFGF